MLATQPTEQQDNSEPQAVDYDDLVADYDRLEHDVEEAAAPAIWAVGDWLVRHVPKEQGARNDLETAVSKLTLQQLSERPAGRTVQRLRMMRRVAAAAPAPQRLDGISLRAYQQALQDTGWNLDEANRLLLESARSDKDAIRPARPKSRRKPKDREKRLRQLVGQIAEMGDQMIVEALHMLQNVLVEVDQNVADVLAEDDE